MVLIVVVRVVERRLPFVVVGTAIRVDFLGVVASVAPELLLICWVCLWVAHSSPAISIVYLESSLLTRVFTRFMGSVKGELGERRRLVSRKPPRRESWLSRLAVLTLEP